MKKVISDYDYSLESYSEALWQARIVVNESCMALRGPDGAVMPLPLIYYPDKILSVRSSHLDTVYTQGIDYTLESGRLIIPAGSGIPAMRYDEYYLSKKLEGASFPATKGAFIAFGEGETFHDKQIAVTYLHSDQWEGPVPEYKGTLLPMTLDKLTKQEELNLVYYGDSITTGANSSGVIGVPPYAPGWPDMVTALLTLRSGAKIHAVNTAVGGMTAKWGEENAYERVASHDPDLVVLAFGMNDGSGDGAASREEFARRIQAILDMVRRKKPSCEFILVSPMLPNKEVAGFWNMQIEYPEVLLGLEKQGIAVANVTVLHEYLLSKKRYFDMTGNNVNHPNDFLARLYLQTICATVLK